MDHNQVSTTQRSGRSRHRKCSCLVVLCIGAIGLQSACGRTPQLDWPNVTKVELPGDLPLYWPDWSPDGTRIVLTSADQHTAVGRLFVVNVADGTYMTPAKESVYEEPHWSPDGTMLVAPGINYLAIASFPDFTAGLRIPGQVADWSPDGGRLAVYASGNSTHDTPSRLWVSDLSGNTLTELFEDPVTFIFGYGGMDWSNSNNLIAFSFGSMITGSILSFHRNIYIADPDGHSTQVLIDGPKDEFSPSWSPDGKWLVYIAADGYPKQAGTITFAKSDGSCIIPALGGERLSGVAWSPDGTRLAVTYAQELYVLDIVATFGEQYGNLDALCGQ